MFDAARPSTHSLLQEPAFVWALRLCGQSPVVLQSGLVLLKRQFFGVPVLMLPRAQPPADLCVQLSEAGLHRLPLILSPETPLVAPRLLRLHRPQICARVDLCQSQNDRRAALHPKWRNQLNRAETSRLAVRHSRLTPDPDTPVLRLEAAQAQARRYAHWPAPLTAAFAKAAPAQTHLFTAILGRQNVAHMLFLSHGGRATYQIGHTTTLGKAHCAHNLLLWQAACQLAQIGIEDLDLGLLHPRTPGLNRFKLRSGAREVQTGGTWLRWKPWQAGR